LHAYLEWGLTGKALTAEQDSILSLPLVQQMCARMQELVAAVDLKPVEMERVVYDPDLRVAGRFDMKATANVAVGLGLVDLKTTIDSYTAGGNPKRPYADQHALQLCAYGNAPLMAPFTPRVVQKGRHGGRGYLLNPAERDACVPATPVGWAAIMHVTPDHAGFYPVSIGPEVRRVVDAVVVAHEWMAKGAAKALGKPLASVAAQREAA